MYKNFIKILIDFIFALIFFIILFPLFLIIAIIIKIDSRGPVFYRPLRGGYKNKPFRIFKFRTMVANADKIGGGTTALNDSRITRVGKFLRKCKLDEIPQLLNILFFNMSFIGPRPELLKYTDNYNDEEKIILSVRPGITDLSCIKYASLDEIVGSENADEVYEEKVLPIKNGLRIEYARKISLLLDLKIFFKTIGVVIKKIFRTIFKRNK